jgi:hypothetical protein
MARRRLTAENSKKDDRNKRTQRKWRTLPLLSPIDETPRHPPGKLMDQEQYPSSWVIFTFAVVRAVTK